MQMKLYLWLLCVQSFNLYGSILSQNDSLMPVDKQTICRKLPNGFTYYLRPTRDSSVDNVSIKLIVRAGFLNEGPGQTQASHIIEHISAAATEHFPDVRAKLNQSGVQKGEAKAFTGLLSTEYNISVPRKMRENVSSYIEILFDQFAFPRLDSATIERERRTVLSELGMPKKRSGFSYEDLMCASNIDFDPYRTVQHTNHVRHDSLRLFHRNFYVAGRGALIVVGDFDELVAEDVITNLFGRLPNVTVANLLERRPNTECEGFRVFVDSTASQGFYSLEKTCLLMGKPLMTIKDLRQQVTRDLFNIAMEERLRIGFNEREVSGIYGAFAFRERYLVPDYGFDGLVSNLHIPISLSEVECLAVMRRYLVMIEQVKRYGFTVDEVENARKALLDARSIESQRFSEDYVSIIGQSFLNGELVPSVSYRDSLYRKLVFRVSRENIIGEMRSALSNGRGYYAVRFPRSFCRSAPSTVEMFKVNSEIERGDMAKFVSDDNLDRAILDDRRIAAIKRKNVSFRKIDVPEINATFVEFQNGILVVLKRLNSSSRDKGRVYLNGIQTRGANCFDGDDFYYALMSAQLVNASGVVGYRRKDIDAIGKRRELYVVPFAVPEYVGVHGECRTADSEIMLQLVRQFIEYPYIDLSDNQKNERLPEAKRSVYDSINDMFKDAPVLSIKPPDSFNVRRNRALRVYKDLFSRPNGYTFFVTGDFVPDSMISLVVPYLGSMPVHSRGMRQVSKLSEVAAKAKVDVGDKAFEVFDVSNGKFALNVFLYNESDGGPVSRAECMLLREIITERLYHRLRTREGYVYGVFVTEEQIEPGRHRFIISLRTSYLNIDEILNSLWDELRGVYLNGVDPAVVMAAADRAIKRLSSDDQGFWQSYFRGQLLDSRSYLEISDWMKILRLMKTADIKEISRKWLEFKSITSVNVGGT